MKAPEFSVISSRDGRRIVVAVAGEIDIASVQSVRHQLDAAEAAGADPLVLDLEDVTFMDSTGVAMIIDAQRRAEAAGRTFALRRVRAQPFRVLQIVGVAEEIPIEL
jgi:anti-anti-sigma factor